MRLTGLAEALRRSGCTTEEQVPMKEHTSFKIGGPADILATAADERAVARAAALCRGEGIPLLLLGNGSNLLVDDGGIRGVTLRLSEAAGPVPPAFCAPCIAPDQRKNEPSRAAALRPARLPFFSHIIQRGVCPSEIIIYRRLPTSVSARRRCRLSD